MSEYKCPWCGGDGFVVVWWSGVFRWYVECRMPECGFKTPFRKTRAEAEADARAVVTFPAAKDEEGEG